MTSPLLFCRIHFTAVNPSPGAMLLRISDNIQADNCVVIAFLGQKVPGFKGRHFHWSLLGASKIVEQSSCFCLAETYQSESQANTKYKKDQQIFRTVLPSACETCQSVMELPEALEISDRNLLHCHCSVAVQSSRSMFENINLKYIFLIVYFVSDLSFSSVINFQCLSIFCGGAFYVELKQVTAKSFFNFLNSLSFRIACKQKTFYLILCEGVL